MTDHGRHVDAEVADLLRDDPDLLAVADAIATTQERPRSRARAIRLLAVAAVLALAVSVALAVPRGGQGGSVLERALAAMGDQPVLHAVIETDWPRTTVVDLSTGATRPATRTDEYWLGSNRGQTMALEGQVISNSKWGGFGFSRDRGITNPAFTTFASGYRQALSTGAAHEVGRGVVDGRRVIWLTLEQESPSGHFGVEIQRQRVAIDAEDYRPVVIQDLDSKGKPEGTAWRVRVIETLPLTPADLVVTPPEPPGYGRRVAAQVTPQAAISPERAASVVGWTPAWLGESFGGLPLRAVRPMRLTAVEGSMVGPKEGLLLTYVRGLTRIWIEQAPSPGLVNGFQPDELRGPPGQALVWKLSQGGAGRKGAYCKAQLQTGGVWVTIVGTGYDRRDDPCILAARALVPIGSPLVHRPASPIHVSPAPPASLAPGLRPELCAAGWNRYTRVARRYVARSYRSASALVSAGSLDSLPWTAGDEPPSARVSGCVITFFLPGNQVVLASGTLVNGTVPVWNMPFAPIRGPIGQPTPNASVSANGKVHLRR